jgi:hypothetical protein
VFLLALTTMGLIRVTADAISPRASAWSIDHIGTVVTVSLVTSFVMLPLLLAVTQRLLRR